MPRPLLPSPVVYGHELRPIVDEHSAALDALEPRTADLEAASIPGFDSLPLMLADTALAYSNVSAGDFVRGGEHFYEVVGQGETDYHLATAGGVKVKVLEEGGVLPVRAFRAKLDGVTDDTAALQAYANALSAMADSPASNALTPKHRPIFYIPPCKGAVITSPIAIGRNVSVVMEGPILVSAAAGATGTWVNIAATTAGNRQGRNLTFKLDVRRLTTSDWVSEADIGVRLHAVAASDIHINRADGFTIGAQVTAPYSNLRLGEFRDNKVGLDIVGTAYDYANQITALGGEFAVLGSVNTGKARYGIRITNPGNNAGAPSNGNSMTFIGQSFELNQTGAGAAECLPFVAAGMYNLIVRSLRMEGSGTVAARLEGDCRWCFVGLIYGVEFDAPSAGLLVDNSTYKIGNKAIHEGGDYDWQNAYLVFDSGALVDRATFYGSSSWHFTDMEFLANTDPATFLLAGNVDAVNQKTREVDLSTTTPAILGVRIDTRGAKTFAVVVDGPTGRDANLVIVAFDANGNQLTANTDILANVATPTNTMNTGAFGGFVSLSSSIDGTRRSAVLTFSANVAAAFIGVSAGVLRGFRIYAVNGTASFWSRSSRLARGARLATTAPVTGWYARGARVQNATPSAAGAPGWVCVTQGQSGTLSSVTADTTSGSRSVTFNDASGLWIGAAVTIAGITGTKIIEALEGNVGFVDSNCDATVSAGAVAYVAPVFKAEASVAA